MANGFRHESREQYGNIAGAKTAYSILISPKTRFLQLLFRHALKPSRKPEKQGKNRPMLVAALGVKPNNPVSNQAKIRAPISRRL